MKIVEYYRAEASSFASHRDFKYGHVIVCGFVPRLFNRQIGLGLAENDATSAKLTVQLVAAESLVPCDSNGKSDPFFVVDLHPHVELGKKEVVICDDSLSYASAL